MLLVFFFFFMLVGSSVEIGSKVFFFFLYCLGIGKVCVSIFYFFLYLSNFLPLLSVCVCVCVCVCVTHLFIDKNLLWLKGKANQDQPLDFKNKSQSFICLLGDKSKKNGPLNKEN